MVDAEYERKVFDDGVEWYAKGKYIPASLLSESMESAYQIGVQAERDRISKLLRAEYAGVGRNASRTAAYRIAKELCIDAEAWTPLMESIKERAGE